MKNPFQKAIEIVGGQSSMARKISEQIGKTVNQTDVWYWLNKAKKGVPAEYCPTIEGLSGIPKEKLRPDVYPAVRQ